MIPSRQIFWHIDAGWLFYLLAALAVTAFVFGLGSRVRIWAKGLRDGDALFSWKGLRKTLLNGVLGMSILKGDFSAGFMHLLIFWGFLGLFAGTVLSTIDHHLITFLEGPVYLIYSSCLEIAGAMLVAGLLWAMIRRYVLRVARLERRPEDFIVLLWLLVAALSGFLTEAVRLAGQRPSWAKWSFIGNWTHLFLFSPETSASVYPCFWWAHALISLGLVAMIPYSKLFHMLAAPAHIFLSDHPPLLLPTEMRTAQEQPCFLRNIMSFDACTRCGRCVEVCPSTGAGEPFAPRDFILWARIHFTSTWNPLQRLFEPGDLPFDITRTWHCTTCRACLEVCPISISTPDSIHDARSTLIEEGRQVPSLLTQTLEKLYKYNNPWEASRKKRDKWTDGLEIIDFSKTKKAEGVCYFVGCTTSIETRAQDLARAFSRILTYAEIPFGTLGKKEPCCGDIARRVGEDGLFEEQADTCLGLFGRYGIGKMVTSSPHCFHTFQNEYPVFQAQTGKEPPSDLQVFHYTQFLDKLIKKGTIRFENPLDLTVTYHDPCYLGRYNGIFDPPREVISAIPGIRLVEMDHCRANSLCCGGGGGRMWQEELDADTKMSEIRIQEAAATSARVLITACPLCLIMLEDARKTTGLEDRLRVMDLNELVATALGLKVEMKKKEAEV